MEYLVLKRIRNLIFKMRILFVYKSVLFIFYFKMYFKSDYARSLSSEWCCKIFGSMILSGNYRHEISNLESSEETDTLYTERVIFITDPRECLDNIVRTSCDMI